MTQVTKVRAPKQTARKAAELAMAEYADLAKRKKKLTDKYKAGAQELDLAMAKLEEQLHKFAEDNEKEFEGKKTLNLEDGTLGWKLAPGRLNFTLEANTKAYEALIREKYPDALEEKVNATIVVRLAKTLTQLREELAVVGVKVEQEDKFFVTPKL